MLTADSLYLVTSTRSTKPGPRERLLATSTRLFSTDGIRAVGIDRILREAGVAKASLYNTYGSKDELVVAYLRAVAEQHPGTRIEEKPAGRVLHTRGLDPQVGTAALESARALGERHTSLVVTPGKEVVELAVAHVGKGTALVALAGELGVDAVFYAGDDLTDEQGFAALADDPDRERAGRRLTVRVGEGETSAQFRVPDEPALVEVFRAIEAARREQRPAD